MNGINIDIILLESGGHTKTLSLTREPKCSFAQEFNDKALVALSNLNIAFFLLKTQKKNLNISGIPLSCTNLYQRGEFQNCLNDINIVYKSTHSL